MKVRRLLPLVALLAIVTGPAQAGLFDDAEARQQIFDINQRLERIESSNRGQLELSNQIEQLRAEVARLRGQVEVLMYDVQSIEKRQKDFYLDLDNRLRRLEGGAMPAVSGASGAPAAAADPAAEGRDYEAALGLFKGGKNKEATEAFDRFIRAYPASTFLPSAHFWAGNAALQGNDVNSALNYFNALLNKWPADPRAPDAMLGMANSLQVMGDSKGSRKALEELVQKFPSSPSAQVARKRLGQS